MPYLLDADWAIQALAGHPQTTTTLERLIATEGVAISWVTVGELSSTWMTRSCVPGLNVYKLA